MRMMMKMMRKMIRKTRMMKMMMMRKTDRDHITEDQKTENIDFIKVNITEVNMDKKVITGITVITDIMDITDITDTTDTMGANLLKRSHLFSLSSLPSICGTSRLTKVAFGRSKL